MCAHVLLHADPLPWLLETDDPGVRYLALRDLCGLPAADLELLAARAAAHKVGPIARVLAHMSSAGYWVTPGPGYSPKYKSTVWAIILLAELGATIESDERIAAACSYLLDHALAPGGQFTLSSSGAPSGTIDCLQGNLCWALIQLGCKDPRLGTALDWLARSVTGEGIAPSHDKEAAKNDLPRYHASLKCGPCFACRINGSQPCAWGAVKVMLALSAVDAKERTSQMEHAIATGVDFLLAIDPATAAYPTKGQPPSRNWWAFGFPVFYSADLLQLAEALVNLHLGGDPRLSQLLTLIAGKQDTAGRWQLEHEYSGRTWGGFGRKGQPNKWVTLRAARVLQQAAAQSTGGG